MVLIACFSKDLCNHKTLNYESNEFTSYEIALLQANGGNGAVNSKYLANYHSNSITSQQGMTQFITSKYVKKKWYSDQQNNKGKCYPFSICLYSISMYLSAVFVNP